jgi:uncharacterized alkaline shock family protein YloU
MSVRVTGAVMADEALVSIVRGAVAAEPGARLDTPGRISRVLPGRRGPVSWEIDGGGMRLDVDLAVGFGTVIPTAAEGVRRRVAEAVTQMTGLEVRSVDVTVTGLGRAEGAAHGS